ncbi:MAG: phosphoribosylanthranilate isomerase, partial [Limnochordales bacterium]
MTTRVKICGLTSPADVEAAVRAGADAVGFVFAESPRRVSPQKARELARAVPPFVVRVGVFVDETYDAAARIAEDAGLHVIQLHGRADEAVILRLQRLGYQVAQAVRMRDERDVNAVAGTAADAVLLDTFSPGRAGGTGRTFDWRLARAAMAALDARGKRLPVVLAGGLTPENVADAVRTVRPFAVDVSSGVETAPGRKCPEKMQRFVRKVR